jgi:hypothetical protein
MVLCFADWAARNLSLVHDESMLVMHFHEIQAIRSRRLKDEFQDIFLSFQLTGNSHFVLDEHVVGL